MNLQILLLLQTENAFHVLNICLIVSFALQVLNVHNAV